MPPRPRQHAGSQALVPPSPLPADAIAAWLSPALARCLQAAGIHTLAQLTDRITAGGRQWHVGIKAIGQGKAARIVNWLQAHDRLADAEPVSEIRPLDRLVVPAELDGANGLYRQPRAQCLLQATNDRQAVLAWLQSRHGLSTDQRAHLLARRRQADAGTEPGLDWLQALSHTQRTYRKEAERLLLWAVVQRGKALSSLDEDDCLAYCDFLADPQPRSRWCGVRARARCSPRWRPFEGPLSIAAQRHAITVLKSLHGYLVDQRYLAVNPWARVGMGKPAGPKLDAGRSFSLAQWQFIAAQLKTLPATSAHQRLCFGLHLLYATGLRLSEVVAATVDHLQKAARPAAAHQGLPAQGWSLRIVGKAQKVREVPLPEVVVDALGHYLVSRGLSADPRAAVNQGAFLLGQASDAAERAPALHGGRAADPRQGIAASTFYDQIKRFFDDCAGVLRLQGDLGGAQQLQQASTHWIRHSHASHAIAGGLPLAIAQRNLGHGSSATTAAYVPATMGGRAARAGPDAPR